MPFTDDEETLNNINLDSVQELNDFIGALRPVLLEESGYVQQKRTRSLEEALSGATQNQRNDLDWYQRSVSEIQKILDDGFSGGKISTATGQERGYGAGVFSRKSLEDHLAKLTRERDAMTRSLTEYTAFEKTDARKEQDKKFADLEAQQAELTRLQLSRVKKVLEDPNFKGSDTLQKQIADEFKTFKEAQARAGNIILGEDPWTAVGKSGTTSIEQLRAFQDNAKAAVDREKSSIINGETPLAYQGYGITAGGYGARQLPASPDYSQLSGLSGAAMQPFQFGQQMGLQQEQFKYQQKNDARNRRTQMISGLMNTGASAALAFI